MLGKANQTPERMCFSVWAVKGDRPLGEIDTVSRGRNVRRGAGWY